MAELPMVTDYTDAIQDSGCILVPKLKGGSVQRTRSGRPIQYSGGFAAVYPYAVQGKKYAVRCWFSSIDNAVEQSRKVSEILKKTKLPYFVEFEVIDDGILTTKGKQPVVIMDWCNHALLKEYIEEHLNNPQKILELAESFLNMAKDLHANKIAHGDLQHGNIKVSPQGKIVLVDYDSICTPELEGQKEEIKGQKGYQHPGRFSNKLTTIKADYFSELIIYTCIVALSENKNLWNELNVVNQDYLLFSQDDLDTKGHAEIFQKLKALPKAGPLSEKIIEFLNRPFNQLEPLEDAIIDKRKVLIEGGF